MSKLSLRKALPISAVLTAFCALPALAGSSYTENTYSLRNITNGSSTTTVDVTETTNRWGYGESYNTKNGYESTKVNQWSGGTDANGQYVSTDLSESDYFDISATSYAYEQFDSTATTKVKIEDSYNYSGTDKTHRTTAGFDF